MKMVQKNSIALKNELVDIQDVLIKTELPQEERIKDYLVQIKNPYHFKYEDVEVEIEYGTKGISIDDCLRGYLQNALGKG